MRSQILLSLVLIFIAGCAANRPGPQWDQRRQELKKLYKEGEIMSGTYFDKMAEIDRLELEYRKMEDKTEKERLWATIQQEKQDHEKELRLEQERVKFLEDLKDNPYKEKLSSDCWIDNLGELHCN